MLKILAPPLGVFIDGVVCQLWDEVDPAAAGLTEADVQALIVCGVLGGEVAKPAAEQAQDVPTETAEVGQAQETEVEPDDEQVVEQPIPNLDPMNAPEAIAIIKTIHDATVLTKLLEQEGTHDDRKTVLAAIHKQLESLQEVS